MNCKNYRCKKNIPDGTKKCPHCGWEQREQKRKNEQQPTIALTVSAPQKQADGSFSIHAYAIARHPDSNLVNDGQSIVFHADDLAEFAESTGVRERGRADHTFSIPPSRAGENVTITAYTQIGSQRCENTKIVPMPKEKEKPPQKKETTKNFFKTLKKYEEGGKR